MPVTLMLLAATLLAGGHEQDLTAAPTPPQKKEPAMIFESSDDDRLSPPEVPAVERDGVHYAQAPDGRDVGVDQIGGVLVAIEIASGKRLWTLAVYGNTVDPALEADAQWIFFTSMTFAPDGRLRIVNEADKTFLVDVKARTATPAR